MTTTTPDAGRYTIAVCKGSALLEETRALLRAWQPTESITEFRDRALREDLLGRMTAYRASDIVRRVFARRFLRPDKQPALLLKRLLERGQPGQLFSDLCLLYAARNDDLIRDAVIYLYWPALSEGRLTISPAFVVEFLRQAERDGRMSEPWSEQVKLKVARGVLKAMADFGLLREVGRGSPSPFPLGFGSPMLRVPWCEKTRVRMRACSSPPMSPPPLYLQRLKKS